MKTWSVELQDNLWNDDTFTGTFDECIEYCISHDYKIDGVEARLAEIDTEDGFCYNMVCNTVYCTSDDCISRGRVDCILTDTKKRGVR